MLSHVVIRRGIGVHTFLGLLSALLQPVRLGSQIDDSFCGFLPLIRLGPELAPVHDHPVVATLLLALELHVFQGFAKFEITLGVNGCTFDQTFQFLDVDVAV